MKDEIKRLWQKAKDGSRDAFITTITYGLPLIATVGFTGSLNASRQWIDVTERAQAMYSHGNPNSTQLGLRAYAFFDDNHDGVYDRIIERSVVSPPKSAGALTLNTYTHDSPRFNGILKEIERGQTYRVK